MIYYICYNGGSVITSMCLIYEMVILLLLLLFWWNPFIPSSNLNDVFNYKKKALIPLRSCSNVNVSIDLTRSAHLFIRNYTKYYIRSLNSGRVLNPHPTDSLSTNHQTESHRQFSICR